VLIKTKEYMYVKVKTMSSISPMYKECIWNIGNFINMTEVHT